MDRARPTGIEVRPKSIRFTFLPGKPRLMVNGNALRPTPANLKYAYRLAAEIRQKQALGTFSIREYFPVDGDPGVWTVGQQLDSWLAAQRVEASTRAGYTSAVRFWKSAIGGKVLRAVKRSDVMTVIAGRPDLAGKTINNRTSVLRCAFDLAVIDGVLPANPLAGMAGAKQQKPALEPFTADEAARILAGAQKRYAGPLANMVEFWFRTGLRTSEIFGLRWADHDPVRRIVLIRGARVAGVDKATTKTNKAREVRLDAQAVMSIKDQKTYTSLGHPYVFVDPYTGQPWANTQAFSRRVWVPLLRLAGVPYRRPYNIRHSRATEMLMAGVNAAFASKQLGHDVKVFLDVYSKWLPGSQDDEEMAKLESGKDSVRQQTDER